MTQLLEKLIEARKIVGAVPKKGTNRGQGEYTYVTADDVVGTVQNALNEVGVDFLAEMIECTLHYEERTIDALVKMRFVFSLGDEYQDGVFWGLARDYSDKAVSKAATSAMKYFLLKKFLSPSGEDFLDPDNSDGGVTSKTTKAAAPEKKAENVDSIIKTYYLPLAKLADKLGIEYEPLQENPTEKDVEAAYLFLKEKVEGAEE